MTSKTVAQLLAEPGVEKSLSRPYTSNDNPYSEAQFKTMKLRPTYPGRFGSLEDAKAWIGRFLHGNNHSHYHTGPALLVHAGQEKAVRAARQQVLQEAYARHLERFARGVPKVGMPPKNVWNNKPQDPSAYPMANVLNRNRNRTLTTTGVQFRPAKPQLLPNLFQKLSQHVDAYRASWVC